MSTGFQLKETFPLYKKALALFYLETKSSHPHAPNAERARERGALGLANRWKRTWAQALTLPLSLHPSFVNYILFHFFSLTLIESQIQLGPGNRGDDPRFLLLGLHHHPDSWRLHRVPAGGQQVTRPAGPSRGGGGGARRRVAETRTGTTAPRGVS